MLTESWRNYFSVVVSTRMSVKANQIAKYAITLCREEAKRRFHCWTELRETCRLISASLRYPTNDDVTVEGRQ